MDFGELLHTAKKNDQAKPQIQYYSTKFAPPKKEQRTKTLSVNVQKFLARKEAEEKHKQQEALERKSKLLALRSQDKKATRRVNVMLKRTKSANQSVIEDALDTDNTAVTLAGPSQPDEDDYGYVSQESSALYNKMMEKYSKMPDEPKFLMEKKKVSTNLSSTKDRVKAALEREREEALLPHRRKRKHGESKEDNEKAQELIEEEPLKNDVPKPKPKFKPAPTFNFTDLLKLAEKKQFEPVVIETKKEEEERPLTKKQKKEMEREKEWRERKESQSRIPSEKLTKTPRIPQKQSDDMKISNNTMKSVKNDKIVDKGIKIAVNGERQPSSMKPERSLEFDKRINNYQKDEIKLKKLPEKSVDKYNNSAKVKPMNQKTNGDGFKDSQQTKNVAQNKHSVPLVEDKHKQVITQGMKSKQIVANVLKSKQFPSNNPIRNQQVPSNCDKSKQQPAPHRDIRSKQYPHMDDRRKQMPFNNNNNNNKKKKLLSINNKRRIVDDDDEDYDSEMDDFIDDEPEEGEDYSKYISEIFGYDKKRYRYDDDDVDNMESSFAQQMKEESISKKIGIMEDMEEMKLEEAARKRKLLMKKKGKL